MAGPNRQPLAERSATGGLPDLPHFAPKAKRVIYLFQSGGPSQLELFDSQAATGESFAARICRIPSAADSG